MMTISRRSFLRSSAKFGMASAISSFLTNSASASGFSQMSGSPYKAIVVISLVGGNDGNNMIVPMDRAAYANYASLRGNVALPITDLLPLLQSSSTGETFGMHPSLKNVAAMYNSRKASVVANVGPIAAPTTKAQILANLAAYPGAMLSHSVGTKLWESSQGVYGATTGWGGRIADVISADSGSLPPVLTSGTNSIFGVGNSIQAIAVQAGSAWPVLPTELSDEVTRIAQDDLTSQNLLVQQIASVRASAMRNQVRLDQASSYTKLKTAFGGSVINQALQRTAQIIAGRSVLDASRQIFYMQQGGYDTHGNQIVTHASALADLDQAIGSFFAALDEIGMSSQVLVCTSSDFCRTIQSNSNGGSDHAWGNNQLVLGGGIDGGRIIGNFPVYELGGPSDLGTQGVWIPTQSVTQMTAGIGNWMGLTANQLNQVFPDLKNFQAGALRL